MPPTAHEAELALREIEAINRRAAGFQDYQAESQQLLLWGVFYMLGFAGSALMSEAPRLLWWLGLLAVAVVIGSRLASRAIQDAPGIVWRYLLVLGIIFIFVMVMAVVMQPLTSEQISMLSPLFVGILYLLRGTQLSRYLLIGTSLLVPCLASYMLAGEYFWWAMSLACGLPLLAAGLWLRYG